MSFNHGIHGKHGGVFDGGEVFRAVRVFRC